MNDGCDTPNCAHPHPARPYACGKRCDTHAPGKMPEGRYCAPHRCYCGACPSYTPYTLYADNPEGTVGDARAIVSGKRRSSPAGLRAARATLTEHRKSA
jgi:hypothetical protein